MGDNGDPIHRFNPFEVHSFTEDRCFLCGDVLNKANRTKEHIFPEWLQRRYHLWNELYTLANGNRIPFRKLYIPCCFDCNHTHLKRVEDTIETASRKGFQEFLQLDDLIIYQWMAKIFYGMLFKKLTMIRDFKALNKTFMASPETLKVYANLYDFLQSTRERVAFTNFQPWSLFRVETFPYEGRRGFAYWNLHNYNSLLILALRMGSIGLIACLEDYGVQQASFTEFFLQFRGVKLQPIQFDELCAFVTYNNVRMNNVPYVVTFVPDHGRIAISLVALSEFDDAATPRFIPWNTDDYAEVLAHFWQKYGLSVQQIRPDSGTMISFLFNSHGRVRILDPKGREIS